MSLTLKPALREPVPPDPHPPSRWSSFKSQDLSARFVLGLAVIILVVLVLYPLGWLIYGSFRGTDELGISNYLRVITEPDLYEALVNTLIIAIGATALSLIAGVPIAWCISRSDVPGKGLLRIMTTVSFMIPGFLSAIAYVVILAPRSGWINSFAEEHFGMAGGLADIYSIPGMIAVTSFGAMAYVVFLTTAALESVDSSMEQSAEILGAPQWKILLGITWPMVTPAILASTLLVFVHSLALFGVYAILGLPVQIYTLPTRIYSLFSFPPDYGAATAMSMILVLLTVACLYAQRRLLQRRSYITTSGKGRAVAVTELGKFKWPVFFGCHLFFTFAVYLPVLVLITASLTRARGLGFGMHNLTFDHYKYVLFEYSVTQRAALNTLILAVAGATITVLLGALISYIDNRVKARGVKFLDYLATIPLGLPGVVLAVGLVLAWIRFPLPIYATMWILLIAYVTRYIPLTVRSADSSIRQIDPSLEEASRITGASWLRGIFEITLPLMKGGLIAGWSLVFVQVIGELAATILLFSVGSETLAIAIYQRSEEGHFEQVATLSVLVLVAAALVLGVARKAAGEATSNW